MGLKNLNLKIIMFTKWFYDDNETVLVNMVNIKFNLINLVAYFLCTQMKNQTL